MKAFKKFLRLRLKAIKDFENKKHLYFRRIGKIVRRYNGKAYIFGSFLMKDGFVGGSDIDILVCIPQLRREIKWEIVRKLKESVDENPRFEFHVIDKDEFELYRKFIKHMKKIN